MIRQTQAEQEQEQERRENMEKNRAMQAKAAREMNTPHDPTEAEESGARSPTEKSPAIGGAEEVQEKFDEAAAQGFFGTKVDPLPNSAYTASQGGDVQPKPISPTPSLNNPGA